MPSRYIECLARNGVFRHRNNRDKGDIQRKRNEVLNIGAVGHEGEHKDRVSRM